MPSIVVHEKVLAHLSRGLYRSPASALRELVSNAWDANATKVIINTNYPYFSQISIHDNGHGFSKEEFEALMKGGIGNSDKRTDPDPLIHSRPVIGRLGIGLLGIAQICGGFYISSAPKHGKPFRAKVRLYDLLKEKLDKDDSSVVHDEQSQQGYRIVDVGSYDFVEEDEPSIRKGTRITSDDVHPTFISSFRKSLELEKYQDPPLKWEKAIAITQRVHSLHELGDYWELLWELAASCPVPYVSETAVPNGMVRQTQRALAAYNFTVLVDGIELRKPVHLKGNPGGYTTERIGPVATRIYGKQLQYDGYIAVQEGSQLKPDELRGIMIRIKNVGIGYYDDSFLDYPYNEGPRAKWVTGEVVVQKGLEDALNVDRDSFNKFHPEYRAIREHVHEVLRKLVFPEVYKQIDKRSEARTVEREKNRLNHLRNVTTDVTGKPVRLRRLPVTQAMNAGPVQLSEDKAGIEIAMSVSEGLPVKKSNRQLAAALLAVYEVSRREHGSAKQQERFRELLMALLSKW